MGFWKGEKQLFKIVSLCPVVTPPDICFLGSVCSADSLDIFFKWVQLRNKLGGLLYPRHHDKLGTQRKNSLDPREGIHGLEPNLRAVRCCQSCQVALLTGVLIHKTQEQK